MAWEKRKVYRIAAWSKNSEESEDFYAESIEAAEKKKAELMEDYEEVWISDEMEEHEFWC